MPENPLLLLARQGQSIWLDNLSRGMLRDGRLRRLHEKDGITGITSNPAIFQKAMSEGSAYDASIRELGETGLETEALYEAMAVRDIQDACDLFRPVFDRTQGTDGFVSLEVSPRFARDADGTVAEAQRLWDAVARPNVFIKIPGTPEGIPAIRRSLARGININITLLFSLDAHREVMEAHLAALEERASKGAPLATVASVASFFLSRIDTLVDRELDAMSGGGENAALAEALRGRAAVASAKLAYRNWKDTYSGPRWEALVARGARVQKPLWASTSTKDPRYSDVKYVEPLIGPHTINTLPESTVDAFRDHGKVAPTLELYLEDEGRALERIERLGISMHRITTTLVEDAIKKFVDPYETLLRTLEDKRRVLSPSR